MPPQGSSYQKPRLKELSRQINNERQCQRHALRKDIQDTFDKEQPVIDIERQLLGLKFNEDVKTNLESLDDKPPEQKHLIATVMTLPTATLEDEMRRRNTAINAITAYCKVEEGGCDQAWHSYLRYRFEWPFIGIGIGISISRSNRYPGPFVILARIFQTALIPLLFFLLRMIFV
jgi:hypothetical protein